MIESTRNRLVSSPSLITKASESTSIPSLPVGIFVDLDVDLDKDGIFVDMGKEKIEIDSPQHQTILSARSASAPRSMMDRVLLSH